MSKKLDRERAKSQDRAPGPRARQPHIAACEGLCEALAERAAPGTLRTLRAVCGLCGRRLTRRFLQGYLQRENNMGNGTRAAVLWVKSGGFGQPKKVLDKGRWSLATTSRPQSPAVRGFPGLRYRRRFSRFRLFGAVVKLRGTTVPSSSGVFHRRCEMGAFSQTILASLIKDKSPRKEPPEEFLTV